MAATSRWVLTTVAGIAVVFVGGILTAGGSMRGLMLIAAAAMGFVIGRISCLPIRRRAAPRVPHQRTGGIPVRAGRAPAPGGGRPRQR
jgi:hypothetical protein